MERFWQEAAPVIKSCLAKNLKNLYSSKFQDAEIDIFIDKDTEQIIKQLKKLYYDKYGDDGK